MSISQSSRISKISSLQSISTPIEKLILHICKCGKTDIEINILKQLIDKCPNPEAILLNNIEGIYYDESTDHYMLLNGGAPATAAHFATVVGRPDILNILISRNISVTKEIRDQLGNPVIPLLIATKNQFNSCINILKTDEALKVGRENTQSMRLSGGAASTCILN